MPASSLASDFLLACLSASRPPAPVSDPSFPVSRLSPSDWAAVLHLAGFHGVAPLLFRRLKESPLRGGMPEAVLEQLRLAYFAGASRNARLYRALRPVLQRLNGAGIRVIVLKGAFLAQAVYGDVALRPMSDVDIMVPKEDLSAARSVLLDMGGVTRELVDVETYCRERHHLPSISIKDLPVEVHGTIFPPTGPFDIDVAKLWTGAQPVKLAGIDVLALAPEDLLLHLCLHFCGTKRLARLRALCDITETIRHYDGALNWDLVVERARAWRATRYPGLALWLAQSMLGAAIPEAAVGRLVPDGIDSAVCRTAERSVLSGADYLADHRRQLPIFDQFGARSLRDKLRLSSRRVFLPRDEMARLYPRSRNARHLGPFYVLRLRDVVRAFSSNVHRRARRRSRKRGHDDYISLVDWLKGVDRPVHRS